MAYGTVLTVTAATGTLADFPALIRVDGTRNDLPTLAYNGANAFTNGGGNFVAYTDATKTTRLPVDIPPGFFVTGASPDIVVWVKVPSMATSATIYVEADSVQTSQPAASSTYGRNNVWSDYVSVWHLTEDGTGGSGSIIDSAGLHDGTPSGWSVSGQVSSPLGYALSFDSTDDQITIGDFVEYELQASGSPNYVVQFWSKPAVNNTFAIGKENEWLAYAAGDSIKSPRFNTYGGNNTSYIGNSVTLSAWNSITHFMDVGTSGRSWVDGSSVGSGTLTDLSAGTTAPLYIGTENGTTHANADLAEFRIATGSQADKINTTNWQSTEYSNQSATSAWYSNDGWSDRAAGQTITLTGVDSTNQFDVSLVFNEQAITLSPVDSTNQFDITSVTQPQNITLTEIDSTNQFDITAMFSEQIILLSPIDSINSFSIARVEGGAVLRKSSIIPGSIRAGSLFPTRTTSVGDSDA